MSLKVFIGSSGEAEETMDIVAEWVERLGYEAQPWNDHTIFPLSNTTFDSLHKTAREVDAALFIFSEDEKAWYRGDRVDLPRDNVLLEFGLFSGVLGKGAVAIATLGKPKLPSDLGGVTYLPLAKKATAKNKLKRWLDELASGADHRKIDRLSQPFQSAGKRSLFEQGTTLIKEAKFRVALVAKTPILVVGSRPYGKPEQANSYEKTQLEEYQSLADAASRGGSLEFRCIGSLPSLQNDISMAPNDAFTDLISSNIQNYQTLSLRKGSNFSFRWCQHGNLMTYVVADNKFLMWFKNAGGENVWITAESEEISGALWDQSHTVSETYDYPRIAENVGLSKDEK